MNNILTHRLMRPLAAAFVGALTTLSFAPYQIWPLAFISPAILLLLLNKQSAKKGAWIGYCWGIGQFATGISWVHVSIDTFGGMPKIASVFLMVLLIAYLAIYAALFGWTINRFFHTSNRMRLLVAAPILWIIGDWLRGWVMTGFPWLWLGYSQIDSPLANFAPIGGVELLTLLVLICSGCLAYSFISKSWSTLAIPAIVFATGYGLNAAQWVTPQPLRSTKIALIQGNIDQALKWAPSHRWPTIMKYTDLSRENWDADIIIWPEAAVPAFEYELPSYLKSLDELARMNNSGIILGILNQNENREFYNSILAVGGTHDAEYSYDVSKRYNKHHLLPFGEFVPFGDILRPIAPFFNLPMSSFSRGSFVQKNIRISGHTFASALCYEIIFNEQVRQNVNEDTDFILTLSNDAWFGKSIGPLQHMEIARMRALEMGKPVVRSTNNGVTAVTDYQGHIIKELPQFETGVLKVDMIPTRGQTPYHWYGSWPLYIWVSLGLIACAINQRKHPSE
ncbi:apolipoprotein N-acyltransferase [Vibrio ziniensis]|uniref:Apolipoprotein N-acyltransferase n=1 Tax=Vibrio ziniensis TaxID=2711221 RepID=A0A6G7CGL8_9VIBR|nr:apolipoprotein N-acyltransferase [Vibrio ziniensis]QIH41186.1 apolipoprotein N-acyltransferase [Vibrio ziniensis]